ncbi:MAG: hypothetical protein OXI11_07425 [Gammaproteobacteria bacterium]|nr:hypothetical protein [Gammaproteobacteria bacterium]
MNRLITTLGVAACIIVLGACTSAREVQYTQVGLQRAEAEIASESLLNVGILVFDPGLPEGASDQKLNDRFIFPEIRRAEARYMPYHLKSTLETTGYWGAVSVLPEHSPVADVVISGRIDQSDGYSAQLRVGAWDSSGRQWFEKNYEMLVAEQAYIRNTGPGQDPYQNLYNQIANDLLQARAQLSSGELQRVREISDLRYGQSLVPQAFSGYLEETGKGQYEVRRLPAADEPMVSRMREVREREYALIDAVNEHYANLYYGLDRPYTDWRRMAREGRLSYEEMRRSANTRMLLGVLGILGAVAYEASGGDNMGVTGTMIQGGFMGIQGSLSRREEARMHAEALREVGESFDAEAEPMVVELEGQTRRLTGSAEERFREWRRLLREIYARETGGLATPGVQEPEVTSQPRS